MFRCVGGHNPGVLGQLPLLCFWIKKRKEKQLDAQVNTEGVNEFIKEITGMLTC